MIETKIINCWSCRRDTPVEKMASETSCKECEDQDNLDRHISLELRRINGRSS